jgi:xylulokinase
LTLLYNPARRSYDPEVLARLDLRAAQLPALLSARQAAGRLRAEAALQTGLPAGIPVSPAIHDQYAAALGTGVVNAGDMMFGAGTAWVLLVVMDRLTEPVIEEAFVCNHPVEPLHGQMLSLRNGGSAVSWAKKLLGLDTLPGFDLDQALESVKPGCDGVGCWPLLAAYGAAGVPPETGGRLVGLQLSHTPAHVLRAVVEGLAFELNRHLDFLRKARVSVRKLVMSGGAASSRVTPQLVADVTGLPVECANVAEASVVGAVLLARALVEPARDLKDLALEIVPAPRRLRPGEGASFYQAKYGEYAESLQRLR